MENIIESTGFVRNIDALNVSLRILVGINIDTDIEVQLASITSIYEICFSPLFYRLKSLVSGEKAGKKTSNIVWSKVESEKVMELQHKEKPKLLFRSSSDCKFKRT